MRTQNRTATSHRLDRWQTKAFKQGRVDENGSSSIKNWQVVVADKTEKSNALVDPDARCRRMDRLCPMPVTSAQGQEPVRTSGGFKLGERFDETHMVLGRVLQSRDVEEKRTIEVPAFGTFGARGHGIPWVETLMIHPVEDDFQAIGSHSEE